MLIDGKHAVGIAIESRTEIGSDLQYFLLQRHQVLRLDGTGRVVGKGAIQFKVERDEMRGQVLKDTRHHHPGHAITGIDHYLERANLADVVVGNALDGGCGQLGGGDTHVAAHCNHRDIQVYSSGTPNAIDGVFGQVYSVDPANVVGFKDGGVNAAVCCGHCKLAPLSLYL